MGDDCGEFLGVNDNIREDPLFGAAAGCPPADGDFCLQDQSPLLPANSPPGCGLIGALGVCDLIGIAGETPAPPAPVTVSAHPNPFAERTTLVIEVLGAHTEHAVRIVDARGSVVIERSLGSLPAGRHRWSWDGRNADGRRMPAGVYFAQVRTGGREHHMRLVVLR